MINAHNVVFGLLLETICRKTGIEFVIEPEQSERFIFIQLEALPLTEGLKRILSNFKYVIYSLRERLGPKESPLAYTKPQPLNKSDKPTFSRIKI